MADKHEKRIAREKLKRDAFERAKAIMHDSLRKDGISFLKHEFLSLSNEDVIQEKAEAIAFSHLEDDSDGKFSDREIEDLIACEKREPAKRQALIDICVALSEEDELPKKLKDWLTGYYKRGYSREVGRGRSPKRMYHTAIFAEAIGTAIGLAAENGLVKKARLWPTRFNPYWDDKSAPVRRRKSKRIELV